MSTGPDLSEMPPVNCLVGRPDFRADNPLAAMMDALSKDPEKSGYARIDLELPLGCPFSLFVVRGFLRDEELPCLAATLCVSRDLAHELAKVLRDSEILEFSIQPPAIFDAPEGQTAPE